MKKILLLGSGELGKEFVISAQRKGQHIIACDSYAGAPAMQVADEFEVFDMLNGEELERVEHEQVAMWQDLKELPVAVQQSRNRVTLLSDKIRQIQRSFERQGLPGLPKDYMDFFFAVNDELGRLKQQLDLSRINVDDVLRQLSIVTADLDTLQENTDNLVEAASVTERLVRKALSYRDNAEVVQATQQARYYYETDFDYTRAMNTLGAVIDQQEQGATARLVNAYRQEQATLQAEFPQSADKQCQGFSYSLRR